MCNLCIFFGKGAKYLRRKQISTRRTHFPVSFNHCQFLAFFRTSIRCMLYCLKHMSAKPMCNDILQINGQNCIVPYQTQRMLLLICICGSRVGIGRMEETKRELNVFAVQMQHILLLLLHAHRPKFAVCIGIGTIAIQSMASERKQRIFYA